MHDLPGFTGTIKAFFRGNGTNVLKIAPETAIKLTFNDRIKRTLVSDIDSITPLQRLSCGALAGAVAQVSISRSAGSLQNGVAALHQALALQFAIYPLELIRTRLAVCPASTYNGIRHAAVSIWRQEGALAFYRGLLPSLVSPVSHQALVYSEFRLARVQRCSSSSTPQIDMELLQTAGA